MHFLDQASTVAQANDSNRKQNIPLPRNLQQPTDQTLANRTPTNLTAHQFLSLPVWIILP